MTAVADVLWPLARAGEALHAVATRCELHPSALPDVAPADVAPSPRAFGLWIDGVARAAGVAVDGVETTYADVDRFLRHGAPAIVRIGDDGVIAVVEGRRKALRCLTPDGDEQDLSRDILRAAMVDRIEEPLRADVERLLAEIGVPEARRPHARATLLTGRLGAAVVADAWLVRLADGAPVLARLRRSRVPRRIAALLAAHGVEYGLWVAAWVLIGRGVLGGRLDGGWLLAWLLLLVTVVPLRAATTWLGGIVTIEAGGLLRRRLLAGAFRLAPEEVRHQGVGRLLGRVLEADAVDALALGGGFMTLTAGVELLVVLAGLLVAGELLLAGALGVWIGVVLALAASLVARRAGWTNARLAMTHELVERMIGHRTRQAQEPADRWHDDEDQALEQYVERSRSLDGASVVLETVAARGWLVVGLAALAPGFVAGVTPAALAVALGSILLGTRALRRGAAGLTQLAGAVIAWRQVAPLFMAATRPVAEGVPMAQAMDASATTAREGASLLEAHDLTFRHEGREAPVLRACTLRIARGDRILLEGPSGAGKSTLGAVLAGWRDPQAGVLLLNGLDRPSLGARVWRRRIVAAPQFHENHVLAGTFLFNVLMGTDAWPPRGRDLDEVEAVCRDLGLGELLARMPGNLFQMVGETGWQLSHGERSRLYIARALLQHADLVVLDESFAALDPENLALALRCVLARASTLVVIAHP